VNDGYDRPSAPAGALRLHLNERTDGCSARALEALRGLTTADAGRYPDYAEPVAAAAQYFHLSPSRFVLTNGLDEGLHAAATLALRGRGDGEGILIEPAFDMYEIVTTALAGRVVRLDPLPDLSPGIERVDRALTARTRIIFINTPMNPTGLEIAADAIYDLARRAPSAIVFVDEAYAEFGGGSLLDDLPRLAAAPNVLVGRTFAKAYGLAGLRAGLVAGASEAISALKGIVPPYSLNAAAAAALPAALADAAHIESYVNETRRSRELLYQVCDRTGLACWKSGGNFVLLRAGDAAPRLLATFAARGIAVRDRTAVAGLRGCIRVTAGRIDDTRRVVDAIEETLCGAR
jgi:histidinol-phosphate aminotransferase